MNQEFQIRKIAGTSILRKVTTCVKAVAMFAALLISPANAQTVDDAGITAAVEREFLYDDAVPFNRISVNTADGIVTLTGVVTNLTARNQADALASIVKGVRAVVNRIDIEATDRTPEEIERALAQAISMDPVTDRYEIDVSVDALGVASLRGETQSWAERSLAETVAASVAGVTRVANELTVDLGRAHRGPGEIAAEISRRMRWDVRIDDSLVNVLARDGGRVILSGTVGSLAEKRHAEELAWVTGVNAVDSSALNVERWARDDDLRRDKYGAQIADSEVREALELALRYDPRVFREPVTVRVRDGVVWLTGEVGNLAASTAAENDARNTVGVRRVHNHLKVSSREVSFDDATIEQHARDILRGRGLLNPSIQLSLTDGGAVLKGDVASITDYWQVNHVVESISGIEELHNYMTVRNQPPRIATQWYSSPRGVRMPGPYLAGPGFHRKTDRELHEDVESEFFWSPFVDGDEVMFDVENGTVTLHGTVETRKDAQAAVLNAYEAGALEVEDQLIVRTAQ